MDTPNRFRHPGLTRNLRRASLLGCALLLLASAATRSQPPPSAPTTLFLVRHAEKSAPNGDLPLSAAGRSRATTLAEMLRDSGVTRIYTTQMARSKETAEPLARRLGLAPEVVAVEDLDTLVARLASLPAGSVALVIHHSGTLPKIVEKLGGGSIAPFSEEEYDRLLVLIRSPAGAGVATLRFGAASGLPPARRGP